MSSTATSGPLKMRDKRTSDRTPRLGTTGLSCVSTRHTTSAPVSLPRNSGNPGSPTMIDAVERPTYVPTRTSLCDPRFTPTLKPMRETVCRYRAITESSLMRLKVWVATPAYGATNSGVGPIGRYSSAARLGSEPIVPSTRSSEPEPTVSKARYRAVMVIRKSLDVVFSRFMPSIMNGGAYALARARTCSPNPRVLSWIMRHVTVS